MSEEQHRPGPPLEVSCAPVGQRWTLVLTRSLDHPVDHVWGAVSEPERLREWAPYSTSRPLTETGAVDVLDNHDRTTPPSPGQVLVCEPPRLLEHSWGVDVLQWEITPDDTGTRLTLRHTMDDRHMVPQIAAGWHLCLDAAEAMLAGRPFGPVLGADAMAYGWTELEESYSEILGLYQDPQS